MEESLVTRYPRVTFSSRVAVCCSVLQCVAVCCSVLQCVPEESVVTRYQRVTAQMEESRCAQMEESRCAQMEQSRCVEMVTNMGGHLLSGVSRTLYVEV